MEETMKYDRFEELPVWKAAIDLAERVYAMTSKTALKGHFTIKDQIERAAVSVSNNIAEGFERNDSGVAHFPLYRSGFGW